MDHPTTLCLILLTLAGDVLRSTTDAAECVQDQNCKLPECFCATLDHPLGAENVPQIVYFGFDDAVQPQVTAYYNELFTESRKNPNGCPITMSLYVSDQYTQYSTVSDFYKRGMEIGVHSVTHTSIDTPEKLQQEAQQQKQNIETKAAVPAGDVVGWRSPNLVTVGDEQPQILSQLQYQYDISLTYSKDANNPWPFTLDYGYPYPCNLPPCPGVSTPHKGFWEVIVHSLTDSATGLNCGYVDGCRPQGEDATVEYLWSNFLNTYETNKAPFGLNMHAAWFAAPEYLSAMGRFIDQLLELPDVYIVNVRQMLEWMKAPVPLNQIQTFAPWGCGITTPSTTTSTSTTTTTTTTPPPPAPAAVMSQLAADSQSSVQFTLDRARASGGNSAELEEQRYGGSGNNVNNPSKSNLSPVLSWYHQSQESNPWQWAQIGLNRKTPAATQPTAQTEKSEFLQRFLKFSGEHVIINSTVCRQGVNCKQPKCFCRTTSPPLGLASHEIPQIVFIALDTRIDGHTFAPLLQLFSGTRENPNGCPISATLFIPSSGNYPPYVDALKVKGLRVGVRAGKYSEHLYGDSLKIRVEDEISRARYETPNFYGWRGFASLAPTDKIFEALQRNNVAFDSSVITSSTDKPWPYTLDFGLLDKCAVMPSHCPFGKYPGMWEVPVKPLRIPGQTTTCTFLDTCAGVANTEDQVYKLLMTNFYSHYNDNKAPFGINLHSKWLTDENSRGGMRGFIRFIDDVLRKNDVAVASVEQMIEWMASPDKNTQNFPC